MSNKKITPLRTDIRWALMRAGAQYQLTTTIEGTPADDEMLAHLEKVIHAVDLAQALQATEDEKSQETPTETIYKTGSDDQPRRVDLEEEQGYPSFIVQSAEVRVDRGKTLLKVRGGDFTTFGVNVWPEAAIEAEIVVSEDDYNALDPRRPPDLRGWKAFYSTTQRNGKTVPNKVVALRRTK